MGKCHFGGPHNRACSVSAPILASPAFWKPRFLDQPAPKTVSEETLDRALRQGSGGSQRESEINV